MVSKLSSYRPSSPLSLRLVKIQLRYNSSDHYKFGKADDPKNMEAEAAVKKLARLPSNTICPNCGTQKKFGFSTVCIKYLTFVSVGRVCFRAKYGTIDLATLGRYPTPMYLSPSLFLC